MIHSLWSIFNDVIAFTANVWQNIDGLVFTGIAVYRVASAIVCDGVSAAAVVFAPEYGNEDEHQV